MIRDIAYYRGIAAYIDIDTAMCAQHVVSPVRAVIVDEEMVFVCS